MADTRKTALITGANKGIGLEVARQLGQAGYTVLVGARDQDRGAEAVRQLTSEGLQAEAIALDVTDQETIARAVEFITGKYGQLDILVNNAGIAGRGLPSEAGRDVIERIFATNFFGAVAVAQAMLPLLRKAPAGRLVNVSSGLGSLTLNADPACPYAAIKALAYSSSKAALNMFTIQLASELKDTNIKVNSADPGYTATDLNGHSGTQTIPEGAAEAVRLALLPADGPTGGFFNSDGPVPW